MKMSKLLRKIDKTILNIMSIFIAGAGLFAALTKYKVPEINYSFYNLNPFAIKRDIIEGVLNWYFIIFALLGLVFRLAALICDNNMLYERKCSTKFYIKFSTAMLFLMFICILIIGNIGSYTAKRKWFPLVMQNQKALFLKSKYIIEHGGLTEDQLKQKDLDDIEKYRKINYESTEKNINQIERLLEIKEISRKIEDRTKYLELYFNVKEISTTSNSER